MKISVCGSVEVADKMKEVIAKPEISNYKDEMISMTPIIINRNLEMVK